MEGALASVFQRMFGNVPDEIANLIAHPSLVNFYSYFYYSLWLFFSFMLVNLFYLLIALLFWFDSFAFDSSAFLVLPF